MKNLLVVNGESYWSDFFPDVNVVQKKIQHSNWILRDQQLFVVDEKGVVQPDAILWRVGAIAPTPIQTTALNLIDLAAIPCVNSPATLKLGFDRLSMLAVLQQCQLPVIPFNVVTQSTLLKNIAIPFPFVVKAGNFHGGYGKILVQNETQWQDIKDLLFITNDYITIEPYINYQYDIRYLAIGQEVWAMTRKGKHWKANIDTQAFQLIEPQKQLVKQVQILQQYLKADILAIDVLEDQQGKQYLVEYNDIPGLSGFPKSLKYALAAIVRAQLE